MMKNVLILNHRNVYSGAEKVMVDTLRDPPANVEFDVIVPIASRLKDELKGIKDVSVHDIKLSSLSEVGVLAYISEIISSNLYVIKLVNNQKTDVIHANTFYSAMRFLFSLIYSRLFGVLTVWTLHDIRLNVSRRIFHILVIACLSRTIVVSDAVLKSVHTGINLIDKKISKIYNAISSTEFKSIDDVMLSENFATSFFSIGMITRWKGQLELVKAWSQWCHELKMTPDFSKLVIIGDLKNDAIYSAEVIANAKQANHCKINFSGYLRKPFEYLSGQGFFVHSSRDPDPLPTVILEAIANGLIPFCSLDGGAAEMLPKHLRPLLTYDVNIIHEENLLLRSKNFTETQYRHVVNELQNYLREKFNIRQRNQSLKSIYFEYS